MWLGTSGLGFEVDFAYHPKFFSADDDEQVFDFDSEGNVITMMGNLVFGHNGGGIQPVCRRWRRADADQRHGPQRFLTEDINDTAFGLNLGGGLRSVGRSSASAATSATSGSCRTSSSRISTSISATSPTGAARSACRSGSRHRRVATEPRRRAPRRHETQTSSFFSPERETFVFSCCRGEVASCASWQAVSDPSAPSPRPPGETAGNLTPRPPQSDTA